MARDLKQTIDRFECAASVGIVTQWVSWPEYETFVRNLVAVAKLLDNRAMNQELRDEYLSYWYLRRALRNTPLHPREYLKSFKFVIGTSKLVGELGKTVDDLRESSKNICQVDNPVREAMFQQFTTDSASEIETVQTVKMLVPLKFVAATNTAINDSGELYKYFRAMGVSEAKKSDLSDSMYIFGAPENYANILQEAAEKSREVAWMFNAPAAWKVIIFQLADCGEFDVSKYEVWAGCNQFEAKSLGRKPLVFIENFEQSIPVDEIIEPQVPDGDPVVDATLVHLFDGRYIYYSDLFPPSPVCVRDGDLDIEIESVNLSLIQRGDVLLIRTGSALRSFLRSHAVKWLEERHSGDDVSHFFDVVDTYKATLKKQFGQPEFILRLRKEGLEDQYVANQIERAFADSTIATLRSDAFFKITNAMGLEYGHDEWQAIVNIRTALRQAGHIARQELYETVLADESWQEIVNEPGIAKLNAGSAGEIVLIPVIQKSDKKVKVSISSLGQLRTRQKSYSG